MLDYAKEVTETLFFRKLQIIPKIALLIQLKADVIVLGEEGNGNVGHQHMIGYPFAADGKLDDGI